MIVKTNETNAGKYREFLAEAYQYLETLEWHNAYQFLLTKEEEEEKQGNTVNLIEEVDLDTDNIVQADKTFKTFAQFKKYEEKYKDNEKYKFDETVYIIGANDLNEDLHSFSVIEQYFNYIEVIKNSALGNHFLLSLPVDEGILNIDANQRTITIPKDFISTVVQKDSLAETIMFTIDRFIDNIDLANSEKIYVQWTAPGENNTQRQMATEIHLKEILDGQIKFGWILNEDVTKYAGKVSFSVVFYTKEFEAGSERPFRLNTLPAVIEVKPALQPEINSQSSIINPGTEFFLAIRNNRYPGQGVKAPMNPLFTFPGKNLENNDPIEGDKPLKFEAQAVVPDNGTIEYSWWRRPVGCEKFYDCAGGYYLCRKGESISDADYNLLPASSKAYFSSESPYILIEDEDKNIIYDSFGTIQTAYRLIPDDEQLQAQDIHYISPDDEDIKTEDGKYIDKIYFKPGEEDFFISYAGTTDQKNKKKYEKYTVLELPADTETIKYDIIGEYFVKAKNKKPGRDSATNKPTTQFSLPVDSVTCEIKGPLMIEFDTEFDDKIFIRDDIGWSSDTILTEDDYNDYLSIIEFEEDKKLFQDSFQLTTGEDGVKTYNCNSPIPSIFLKRINLTPDLTNTSPLSINYEWIKKESLELDSIETTVSTNNTIEIRTPGYYKVKMSSTKNRKTTIKESEFSKLTFYPDAPVLSIDETITSDGMVIDGCYTLENEENTIVTLAVSTALTANGINVINNALYSDSIKYEWYVQELDKAMRPVKITDLDTPPNDFNTNQPASIKVNTTNTRKVYKCIAKNILSEVESNSSNEVSFSVG